MVTSTAPSCTARSRRCAGQVVVPAPRVVLEEPARDAKCVGHRVELRASVGEQVAELAVAQTAAGVGAHRVDVTAHGRSRFAASDPGTWLTVSFVRSLRSLTASCAAHCGRSVTASRRRAVRRRPAAARRAPARRRAPTRTRSRSAHGVRVAVRGVGHPVVPQRVVERHDAAGPQQPQRLLVVDGVRALVGVDEHQVVGAVAQPGQYFGRRAVDQPVAGRWRCRPR